MKKRYFIIFVLYFVISLKSFSVIANSVTSETPKKTIILYGDTNCHLCRETESLLQEFENFHPEININYEMHNLYDPYHLSWMISELEEYGIEEMQVPIVILIWNNQTIILYYDDITLENLEFWSNNGYVESTQVSLNEGVSFLSGLIIGASPCVLLILSVFGTSLSMETSKSKYLKVSIGFITGILLAYLVVSLVFILALPYIGIFQYFKYVFSAIFVIIGIWQIIDYKNEESRIFGTPTVVKGYIKRNVQNNSGFAALLIGFIFGFIKIPCFGGVFLSIIYAVQNNSKLWNYILFYMLGMIIPVIIVFILLRLGLKSEKINTFREEAKPYLRILSGLMMLTIIAYLLLETQGFTISYLILAIILEILIIGYFILNNENNKTRIQEKNQ